MIRTPSVLERIFQDKRQRVKIAKAEVDLASYVRDAARSRQRTQRRFRRVFVGNESINIIAEIKRASPSRGELVDDLDIDEKIRAYEKGGAKAISVLTEEDNFGGSIEDLKAVRKATSLPVLRKDFVFDEYQVYESALLGVDAILLIAAVLDDLQIRVLQGLAGELGMDALVEVHNENEMERVLKLKSPLIGINNRNLHTFEVSLDTSRKLGQMSLDETVLISESGIGDTASIEELRRVGFRGFLVGETLMLAEDASRTLCKLRGKS